MTTQTANPYPPHPVASYPVASYAVPPYPVAPYPALPHPPSPPALRGPARVLTAAWIANTLALVAFCVFVVVGLATIFGAIAAADWTDAAVAVTLGALLTFAASTITGTVTAVVATVAHRERRGQLIGVWVLAALNLVAFAYVGAFILPIW